MGYPWPAKLILETSVHIFECPYEDENHIPFHSTNQASVGDSLQLSYHQNREGWANEHEVYFFRIHFDRGPAWQERDSAFCNRDLYSNTFYRLWRASINCAVIIRSPPKPSLMSTSNYYAIYQWYNEYGKNRQHSSPSSCRQRVHVKPTGKWKAGASGRVYVGDENGRLKLFYPFLKHLDRNQYPSVVLLVFFTTKLRQTVFCCN